MQVKVRSKGRLAPGTSITQTIQGFNSQYRVSSISIFYTCKYTTLSHINKDIDQPKCEFPENFNGELRELSDFRSRTGFLI